MDCKGRDDMENHNEKMFTISIDKEFDVMKKEFNSSIYLRVYTSLFQAGVVKDLKATNFTVLLAIASFMDAEGNCYPTQRQISTITGMSTPTVNKAVNALLEFKVNDKPIITRDFVQQGQFKNSYYTVNPLSQIAIFDGLVKEIETTGVDLLKKVALNNSTLNNSLSSKENAEPVLFKNSKEVAVYFLEQYQLKYGVQCSISWQRDVSLIKKKLIAVYTQVQIKQMIDTVIADYDSRWAKPSYPRPSISMMCSWLGEQALAISENGEKEFEELTELTVDSDDENNSVLAKFGVKKG